MSLLASLLLVPNASSAGFFQAVHVEILMPIDEEVRTALQRSVPVGREGVDRCFQLPGEPREVTIDFKVEKGAVVEAISLPRTHLSACLVNWLEGWYMTSVPDVSGRLVVHPPKQLIAFIGTGLAQPPPPHLPPPGRIVPEVFHGDMAAQEAWRHTVYRRMGKLRDCYEGRLVETPDLQGKLTMNLEYASSRVGLVQVSESDLADPQVEACLVSTMRMWLMPDEGASVGVTLSFTPVP